MKADGGHQVRRGVRSEKTRESIGFVIMAIALGIGIAVGGSTGWWIIGVATVISLLIYLG